MQIGFVGAGRMASALACGIAKSPGNSLVAFDPSVEALAKLRQHLQEQGAELEVADSNQALINCCEVIVVAVKPQVISSALAGLATRDSSQLVVSVVAGTKIETLVKLLGTKNVVRAMPNTPCLIGQGVSGYCVSAAVSAEHEKIASSIFESVGSAIKVDEEQLDAVTGLSGSGPAYVYTFIEAMIDAGVSVGLPHEVASELALRTITGATQMVESTGHDPAQLRDQVTSPGGTTLHGLQQIEKLGFRESVLAAVKAATLRSIELSGG